MRKSVRSLLIVCAGVAGTVQLAPCQAPAAAAPQARPAPIVSPEVLPDHRVVFRLRAPDAHEVNVSGDFWFEDGRVGKLARGDNGVWSLTTEALAPDVYSYFFSVDGMKIADPANGWIKTGTPPVASMFAVPGPEEALYEMKPVPHGEVRVVYYDSQSLGRQRRMHVYLPPGYEQGNAKYPVIYLGHGGGEEDYGWIDVGRVNFVLDNLIAAGKAKPAIVVMPSLYAIGPPIPPARAEENDALFGRDLVEDLIPYVESHYRVLEGPGNRALGGLSVGRNMMPDVIWAHMASFNTYFFVSGGTEPDRFAYMQKTWPGVLDDPANSKRVHFFMGDGASDHSILSSQTMAAELKKRGYSVTTFETTGAHGWPSFRRSFVEWVQTAFR